MKHEMAETSNQSNMNIESGWSSYINLLIYLGVVPISIDKSGNIVSNKIRRQTYLKSFTILTISNLILLSVCIFGYWFDGIFNTYNETGRIYEYFQEISSGFIVAVVLIWMFCFRELNFQLLKEILNFDSETKYIISMKNEINYTKRHLRIILFSIIFYVIDSILAFSSLDKVSFIYFLQVIQYDLNFIYISTILSIYTAIIWKIVNILQRINERLSKLLKNNEFGMESDFEIFQLLRIRNEVLCFCSGHLTNTFGFVILLASLYTLISFTQIWFFIVVTLEIVNPSPFRMVLKFNSAIIWLIPKMVILIIAFNCNSVGFEVSLILYYYFKINSKHFFVIRNIFKIANK